MQQITFQEQFDSNRRRPFFSRSTRAAVGDKNRHRRRFRNQTRHPPFSSDQVPCFPNILGVVSLIALAAKTTHLLGRLRPV